MQEPVFVELKDVTEELAARVRAGEIEVEVTTPRAKWWQTVAAHTYKTVRVAEGRRYVAEEKRLEYLSSNGWKPLTDQLLKAFDPEAYAERMSEKAARKSKARAKAAAEAANVKVGDIFYSYWGYDQTNSEFYEVVRKSGQYVTVREICADYEETGWYQRRKTPRPGEYVEDSFEIEDNARGKRCRVNEYGNIAINKVVHAWKWDGRPVEVSSYA